MLWHPLYLLLGAAIGAGALYFLFRPRAGFYWRHGRRRSERVLIEDALKHLYECETEGRSATLESLAGAVALSTDRIGALLTRMERSQLVRSASGRRGLTEQGRAYALNIVRAHRLWEQYLAAETGYDDREWHRQAEAAEHRLSGAEADALAARLGHPRFDPHGDPIPTAAGEIRSATGRPLTSLRPGETGRIVHLEDEPESLYDELVTQGLQPGMHVRVSAANGVQLRIVIGGVERELSALAANNVTVAAVAEAVPPLPAGATPLPELPLGHSAVVVALSPRCRGAERRRLLDLGILPGTAVKAELRSPGGDPTAYNVRGALIALRRDQARFIQVQPAIEGPDA